MVLSCDKEIAMLNIADSEKNVAANFFTNTPTKDKSSGKEPESKTRRNYDNLD